jgi:MFS family permease
VQIVSWVAVGVPILALVIHSGVLRQSVAWVYPLLYLLLGIVEGSVVLGFLNFVLEIAPPGQRPTYMGLTNTVAGLLILVPLVGGFLLERTSYPVVFALAVLGTLAGAITALRLPNPRREQGQMPGLESTPHVSPAP